MSKISDQTDADVLLTTATEREAQADATILAAENALKLARQQKLDAQTNVKQVCNDIPIASEAGEGAGKNEKKKKKRNAQADATATTDDKRRKMVTSRR